MKAGHKNTGPVNNTLARTGFWTLSEDHSGEHVMLLETSGQAWTYRECCEQVTRLTGQLSEVMPATKGLCALIMRNNPASVTAYLACLQAGHAVILLHPDMSATAINEVCMRYRVNVLITSSDSQRLHPEYTLISTEPVKVHAELAVLLSTSGSSGSPKLVRLSYRNLQANAESIVRYLSITRNDRAIAHLPLHYSYGLSVLNSHLLAGASCVLHDGSIVERPFWQAMKTLSVNNLAGVPYTYELLSRLRFEPSAYSDLRYMTQAGGKLCPELVRCFAQKLRSAGKQLFLMYGQTEATARMSYLPPELCETHPESIGQPIPGGKFDLLDEHGSVIQNPDQPGELVYSGDNVMMGYAHTYQDLARDHVLEILHTGDQAWRDAQGLYFLKGRIDRIRKVFGNRIDLDELQTRLQDRFGSLACVASESRLCIYYETEQLGDELKRAVDDQLQLPPSAISLHYIDQLPRTVNGKLDYRTLEIGGLA